MILLRPDSSYFASQPLSNTSELLPLTTAELSILRTGQPLIKSQYNLSLSDTQAEAFAPVLDAQTLAAARRNARFWVDAQARPLKQQCELRLGQYAIAQIDWSVV